MSIEQEIRDILADISHHEDWGKAGQTPSEAHVSRQLEGIWTSLLLIAKKLDVRP